MPEIVIIGGGLAGMASAQALAHAGFPALLLESRSRLGGRASSFVDQLSGTIIDNCQHVSLGCCTNFQYFCQQTGIDQALQRETELTFIGADRRKNHLRGWPLPAPFHLLPSFARFSYLTWYDKWRLAWGLKSLAHRRNAHSQERMSNWLMHHRQTDSTINRVWHPVLVSALSESLEHITVSAARKVFVDAFLANRHGWEMQVPSLPLDTLYTRQVGDWLTSHGVEVRLQSGVQALRTSDHLVTEVLLRDGTILHPKSVILAVPAYLVPGLLPPDIAALDEIQALDKLEWAPISSVHLWFDRRILPLKHATLVDRLSQWVFYRGQQQQPDSTLAEYFQVVISGSRGLAGRSQDEIIRQVVQELIEIWPEAGPARLLAGRVVTEHRACLSMQPGVDQMRPASTSPLKNLYFAGDWTRTGWPSTMEGAVRSGYIAAESVLEFLGHSRTCVQPDLPVSWLSKNLLRL